MYCKILSAFPVGIDACLVEVEVDTSAGLPVFQMVGSIGSEVRESRERVSVALKNAGFRMPVSRVTVNFSPADIRKEGTGFDLAIAVGLLINMEYFNVSRAEGILFLGELGLNGEIRRVRGVLPMIRTAAQMGVRACIVPKGNMGEGAVVPGICVMGAETIADIAAFMSDPESNPLEKAIAFEEPPDEWSYDSENDFARIAGQETAKKAAKIAAAGFHNLLMTGPPGAGKSMIARCIPEIMPPLSRKESLEVTSVRSVAGLLKEKEALVTKRPFMNPHHSVTMAAMTGGGVIPKPGVMSLAHRGVLFMDELPEFGRAIIDAMRQPMEERRVQVARVQGNISYPAFFLLVCAMNPCPCGYYPDTNRCRCTENAVRRYIGKISGPILDRIDLCVELHPVEISCLNGEKEAGESSIMIRSQVMAAREKQKERFEGTGYSFNAEIAAKDIEYYCGLGEKEKRCMERIYEKFELSARSYHRILKCARTLADLENEKEIREEHLLEATAFRPSRDYWRG